MNAGGELNERAKLQERAELARILPHVHIPGALP